MDYTLRICGQAGQGIQTIGGSLARYFARSGYHIFTNKDYESRVRGGHNYYQLRVSDMPVISSLDRIDILVALDAVSLEIYRIDLKDEGHLIYDSKSLHQEYKQDNYLDIPFEILAAESGGSKIMSNSVATGAILGLLGMDLEILNGIIRESFAKKEQSIQDSNIAAAAAGHQFAVKACTSCPLTADTVNNNPRMLISGSDAIGLGAVASGLKFYSAYPMTPSTGIMNYIADKEVEYGIIVEQAEDEIAAINMALGASYAGVRSMTGTSGGGFALMTEGLSLAGITETPIVIALAQRPGPATGLPTRTEQGDLNFALHAGHGEFPRVILAPGSPEQAFYLTNKAFGLAEKYQVPVIILTDQYLADSEWTYDGFDTSRLHNHDQRLRGEALANMNNYKRYACTDSGVTPMAVPGESVNLVVVDSDEHNEEGHMIEDAATRNLMMDKRIFKKLPHIREEISAPAYYGSEKPEIVLVGWGSTYGVLKETVQILSGEYEAAMLHFSEIYPLPEIEKLDYAEIIRKASVSLCIENNATGQFERLLRAEAGISFTGNIRKYDGRPFSADGLTGEVNARI
ncbi:MAG: 2-oxoacid:acceptor oxidoreductase subunit alpha [Nitrospira sp.]|nr:2-oxoacid:acceptor oxidoreductase subunit alpha [bacterium]MBL7048114.1 2-oxoacid:acceptor oxidoreductase subunit alpha [Nitrospira sp.]